MKYFKCIVDPKESLFFVVCWTSWGLLHFVMLLNIPFSKSTLHFQIVLLLSRSWNISKSKSSCKYLLSFIIYVYYVTPKEKLSPFHFFSFESVQSLFYIRVLFLTWSVVFCIYGAYNHRRDVWRVRCSLSLSLQSAFRPQSTTVRLKWMASKIFPSLYNLHSHLYPLFNRP